jgi:cbb3-type cytochrome oxidase cytochrome c subunit
MSATELDTEHLADVLAAGDGAAVPADQLAALGRAHAQLLARVRKVADQSQIAVNDLAAAQGEVAMLRAVISHLRSLITSGKFRDPLPEGTLVRGAAC